VFSHDVQNNETAAMLVFQINLLGVEIFSHENVFFVPVKLHGCWPHEGKHFIGLKIVSFLMSFSLFNFILDGLMSLLKQIGQGYVHLSSYECKQALNAFSALAPHHYNTGWVLTQVGRAHFELAEYQLVKYYYL